MAAVCRNNLIKESEVNKLLQHLAHGQVLQCFHQRRFGGFLVLRLWDGVGDVCCLSGWITELLNMLGGASLALS